MTSYPNTDPTLAFLGHGWLNWSGSWFGPMIDYSWDYEGFSTQCEITVVPSEQRRISFVHVSTHQCDLEAHEPCGYNIRIVDHKCDKDTTHFPLPLQPHQNLCAICATTVCATYNPRVFIFKCGHIVHTACHRPHQKCTVPNCPHIWAERTLAGPGRFPTAYGIDTQHEKDEDDAENEPTHA